MSAANMPKPGDRVGVICGPGDFPRIGLCASGIVLCISSSAYYDHIATVLMDDGSTKDWVGAYTTRGIGCYLLRRSTVSA